MTIHHSTQAPDDGCQPWLGKSRFTWGGGSSVTGDIMTIAAWLQPQCILLDTEPGDRAQALEIIAAAIGRDQDLDPAPICRSLWRREQAGSTALGKGFAIPHARIDGIARPLTLFMRLKTPIAFDAPDGQPVSQLLAIMAPTDGAKDDHLQLLALVARLFSDEGFCKQLRDAADPTGASEAFRAGIARIAAAPR